MRRTFKEMNQELRTKKQDKKTKVVQKLGSCPLIPGSEIRPERILVTRTDRIGDLVVSLPVLKALREKFRHAHIAVCVFLEHRELVIENPNLDEVILYDKHAREKNWLGQLKFAREIGKKNFDMVIHLHATNRMHVMSWLAGIPIRIGYDRRAPWALTQVHPYDKKEGHRHEGEYLFDLLKDFEIEKSAVIHPKILVSAKARLSLLIFY